MLSELGLIENCNKFNTNTNTNTPTHSSFSDDETTLLYINGCVLLSRYKLHSTLLQPASTTLPASTVFVQKLSVVYTFPKQRQLFNNMKVTYCLLMHNCNGQWEYITSSKQHPVDLCGKITFPKQLSDWLKLLPHRGRQILFTYLPEAVKQNDKHVASKSERRWILWDELYAHSCGDRECFSAKETVLPSCCLPHKIKSKLGSKYISYFNSFFWFRKLERTKILGLQLCLRIYLCQNQAILAKTSRIIS